MKRNVGGLDYKLRILAGIVLLLTGLSLPLGMVWRIVVLALAAIALLTATTGYCPANAMLGIDTCKDKDELHA